MPNCEKKAGSSGPEVLHGITIVESDMLYCTTATHRQLAATDRGTVGWGLAG